VVKADPESRVSELGIELPQPPAPVASYVGAVRTDNLLFLAGRGPDLPGHVQRRGRVGRELTIDEGYRAARGCAINLLATVRAELGSLNRVARIVKVLGFVNSASDFFDQPAVVDGCSDLLVEIFGEDGLHARSAIGTSCLPNNLPIEVEMIVEVRA
jgi:enamine deaminase RidA (YjgF/YER057c/UK114 family)